MFWKLVGYGKDGRTSEGELTHLMIQENEWKPSEKVRRKDLKKRKFQFKWEVGMSCGNVEDRWELLAVPSTISPITDRGPTSCSAFSIASV